MLLLMTTLESSDTELDGLVSVGKYIVCTQDYITYIRKSFIVVI